MITRIFIDNFKTFDNFECALDSSNLILGNNGVGKSSLLDVLAYLRDFIVYGVMRDSGKGPYRFGSSTYTRWTDKPVQTFELDLEIGGVKYFYRLKIDECGRPKRPRTFLEEVICDGSTIFKFEEGTVHLYNDYTLEDKVQYPFDWYQPALSTIYPRTDNQRLILFKNAIAGLVQLRANPWAIVSTTRDEDARLDSDAGNFASWYRHMRQISEIDSVGAYIHSLKNVIPELKDLTIRGEGAEARELVVRPNATQNADAKEYVFPVSEMSEGQRMLIVLYAVMNFMVKEGATICLDEPDNFLAIREVQPFIAELLERAEDVGGQVIVTSHHPDVLNYMAQTSGKVFERLNGLQTRMRRFESEGDIEPAEVIARDSL